MKNSDKFNGQADSGSSLTPEKKIDIQLEVVKQTIKYFKPSANIPVGSVPWSHFIEGGFNADEGIRRHDEFSRELDKKYGLGEFSNE